MVQRKLLLLALVLLLLPVGMVAAQSSTSFEMQRFVTVGGGSADSANYKVTSVIGQPVTDVAESSNYRVSGGFLLRLTQVAGLDLETWLPLVRK
jgi:hypothetical protein